MDDAVRDADTRIELCGLRPHPEVGPSAETWRGTPGPDRRSLGLGEPRRAPRRRAWQAAHTSGEHALVTCPVAPGFEFSGC